MNCTEVNAERELSEHIEKLIAAIRGSRIAEVWFEIKEANTADPGQIKRYRSLASLSDRPACGNQNPMPKKLNLQKKLGLRIADLRKSRELTQAQLAKSVGCTTDFIGLVERGINAPTVARLERFARVLKVEVRGLFTFDRR